MKFRDLEKLLKKNGWSVDHATGSHYIYTHPLRPGTVTVPFHGTNSDLGDAILRSVLKQAVKIMAKFIAQVGQAGDGSWTAPVIGEHTVLGTGDSKEAALENLREGVQGLVVYLAEKGLPLPNEHVEFVEFEVAA